MEILNGKKVSALVIDRLKEKIKKEALKPKLDVVMVGDDYASTKYVALKSEKAREIGVECRVHLMSAGVSELDVIQFIDQIKSMGTDGIMVQLPLPEGLNREHILSAIPKELDVDGLNPCSLGELFSGLSKVEDSINIAATAKGVMLLLDHYGIELKGKQVAILNDSPHVGLPLAALMLKRGATVSITHKLTHQPQKVCSQADILLTAVGISKLIDQEYVKDGAVLVDIGISKDEQSGKLSGDMDFEKVKEKASYITPVPGGVGPMTIAALLYNVVRSCDKNRS